MLERLRPPQRQAALIALANHFPGAGFLKIKALPEVTTQAPEVTVSWACVSTPSATIFNPKLCPRVDDRLGDNEVVRVWRQLLNERRDQSSGCPMETALNKPAKNTPSQNHPR